MKINEALKVYLFVILTFFSFSIKAQIKDSIIHRPFANVDSIEYWHMVEQKDNNQEYWTFGYYQNCNCDYHKFLNQKNYKSRNKHYIAEGMIVNGMKQGEWIYWINVKGMCCDELQIYPDSTVTFNLGKRIEKVDNSAKYFYRENEIIEVIPNQTTNEFKFKIVCKGSKCTIIIDNEISIKTFEKVFLEEELKMVTSGEYNFKARQELEKTTNANSR